MTRPTGTAATGPTPADPPSAGIADRVAPSNARQLAAWDGDTGRFWVDNAERIGRGVAGYTERFLDRAAVRPDAAVLDVGCGSGAITRALARTADRGHALGIDLSAPLVGLARQLAERDGPANVRFQQADAQTHPFPEASFDVAVSRMGAMFFGDAPAAFTNLARALRPGAHLVLLTWRSLEHNEWLRTFLTLLAGGRDLPGPSPGAPGPLGLCDPAAVRVLLTGSGFTEVEVDEQRRPMYVGTDAEDATRFVAAQFDWATRDLGPDDRTRAVRALRDDMADHQRPDGVFYDSAAWLVRARRG